MHHTLFLMVIAMSTMDRDYTKRDGDGDLKILSEQPKNHINHHTSSNHIGLTQKEFDRMRGGKCNTISNIVLKFKNYLKFNK